MRGAHKRFLERQALKEQRGYGDSNYYTQKYAALYEQTMGTAAAKSLKTHSSDGGSLGGMPASVDVPINANLRVGNTYYIKCPDDTRYYRSVYIKANPLSSTRATQALISNPVMGEPPTGLTEISPQQLSRYMNSISTLDAYNNGAQQRMKREKFKEWSETKPPQTN